MVILIFTLTFVLSTFMYRLMEDELPLSLIEKRNGKKEVVLQEEDWNGLEIKTISELFVANQVIFIIMSFFLGSLHLLYSSSVLF